MYYLARRSRGVFRLDFPWFSPGESPVLPRFPPGWLPGESRQKPARTRGNTRELPGERRDSGGHNRHVKKSSVAWKTSFRWKDRFGKVILTLSHFWDFRKMQTRGGHFRGSETHGDQKATVAEAPGFPPGETPGEVRPGDLPLSPLVKSSQPALHQVGPSAANSPAFHQATPLHLPWTLIGNPRTPWCFPR